MTDDRYGHTYRQSSVTHPENSNEKIELTDPQNILLYKMPVRRLQAEFIRDSILSFSGRLDSKMYGKSIPIHRTRTMNRDRFAIHFRIQSP